MHVADHEGLLRHLVTSVVFRHVFSAQLLDEEWTHLKSWMHLAVDEGALADVPLREFAKDFVFRHDTLVDLVDESEVFIGGIFVAVYFIVHCRAQWSMRNKSLEHEEVQSASC